MIKNRSLSGLFCRILIKLRNIFCDTNIPKLFYVKLLTLFWLGVYHTAQKLLCVGG